MKQTVFKIFINCICICVALLCVATGCSNNSLSTQSAQVVLRYAETLQSDHPTTQAAYYFAQQVNEKTEGRIKIIVYPSAELGTDEQVITQLQLGAIDFASVNTSSLTEVVPSLSALQLPYIFEDTKHMWAVLDGEIGAGLRKQLSTKKVEGLAWFDAGAKGFYSNKKLSSLDDLEGLTVGVLPKDKATIQLAKIYGALPVEVSTNNVQTAIEKNIINAAENDIYTYVFNGHKAFTTFFFADKHSFVTKILVASSALEDELSQKDYNIILECAKQSEDYQRDLYATNTKDANDLLEFHGVVVTDILSTDLIKHRDQIQQVYAENYGENKDLIYQIRLAISN